MTPARNLEMKRKKITNFSRPAFHDHKFDDAMEATIDQDITWLIEESAWSDAPVTPLITQLKDGLARALRIRRART
jgi:hypothetical protein